MYPSRAPARSASCTLADGRDDRAGPRGCVDGDGWRGAVVREGLGRDIRDCNNADRDHRSDRCRKPRCIHGIFAAEKQPRPDANTRKQAAAFATSLKALREKIRSSFLRGAVEAEALKWRNGDISDEEFIARASEKGTFTELRELSHAQGAGSLHLLVHSPTWYDDFWFISTMFSISRLQQTVSATVNIVEGYRNRYVWLALEGLGAVLGVPPTWWQFPLNFTFQPNIAADGTRGYMCSDEIKYALLVHSSQAEVLRFCESASGKVADSISRFILGRDLRDRRSLGHELWDLLMATQDRWSFGTSPESMETAFTLDPLLEVFDRGKFNRDLADLTSTATENQPLTLIMIDIDYFKPVNDTFGHPVGDAVLKKVAALIKAATDRKGHVYRYGGEEVAVLLPNFDVIEGLACGERVRQIIEMLARIRKRGFWITRRFGGESFLKAGSLASSMS